MKLFFITIRNLARNFHKSYEEDREILKVIDEKGIQGYIEQKYIQGANISSAIHAHQ